MKYILAFISGVALLLGAGLFYVAHSYCSAGPLAQLTNIILPKGTGVVAAADLLQAHHVIAHKYIFIAAVKFRNGASLKAGEYEFPAAISMEKALDKMLRGDVVHHRFTIPEGLTSFEIINLLSKVERLSNSIEHIPSEGALLPETYDFETGDTRQKKVDEMAAAMTTTLATLWAARASDLPFKTPQEALTLASIVEKETGKASERKIIAGVFLNRLKIGMPLQSDPTVIYALTMGQPQSDGQGPLGRRLLSKDLSIPSPYNTYLNVGLPPAPIANPGKDAIAAVLNPEHHDYLYFVADGTGGHVFAKTLQEHNQNVDEWRKKRREMSVQP